MNLTKLDETRHFVAFFGYVVISSRREGRDEPAVIRVFWRYQRMCRRLYYMYVKLSSKKLTSCGKQGKFPSGGIRYSQMVWVKQMSTAEDLLWEF